MNNKNEANTENIWKAFGYEVEMYVGTSVLLIEHKAFLGKSEIVRNAVAESRMLHTRIMVDILTDHASQDDFSLSDLLIDFSPEINIEDLQQELREAYGTAGEVNSPCWTINKMLAHPTKLRTDRFDWGSTLNKIEPIMFRFMHLIAEYCERPDIKKNIKDNY